MSSAWSITRSVNPPRAAFVDFPLGHTTGRPHEPELTLDILSSALASAQAMTEPGTIVGLPHRWPVDDWRDDPMGARGAGGDSRTERTPERVYQSPDDEAAARDTTHADHCLNCIGIET